MLHGWIFLPEPVIRATSGLLEVEVRASLAGQLSDPSIEIMASHFNDIQFLERGAQGVRFLNVSRLLGPKIVEGEKVRLRGHGLVLRGTRGAIASLL